MKIPDANIIPLVKEIVSGTIDREKYPEIWPITQIRVIHPGYNTQEFKPLPPVEVPKAERRKLAKAILKGEVDTDLFPGIWPEGGVTVTIWPEWDEDETEVL